MENQHAFAKMIAPLASVILLGAAFEVFDVAVFHVDMEWQREAVFFLSIMNACWLAK
jgi:hypothetical protein